MILREQAKGPNFGEAYRGLLTPDEIDQIVDTVQVHANMRAQAARAELLNRHCTACTVARAYGLEPAWDPWAWDWTGI